MNHWRVRRCYGFGAGHIPLLPDVHRHSPVPDPFFSGLRTMSREMFLDGEAIRRLVTTAPVFAIALAAFWILIAKLMLTPGDESDIEVVLMRTAEPHLEPVPQPLPEPVIEVEPPRAAPEKTEVAAAVKPPEPVIEILTPEPVPRTRVTAVEPPPRRVRPEVALPSLPASLEEPSAQPSQPRRRTTPEVVAPTRLRPALAMASAVAVTDVSPVTLPRRTNSSAAPVIERQRSRPTLAAVSIALAEPKIKHAAVRRPGPRPPSAKPNARILEIAALGTPSMTAAPKPRRPHSSSRRSLPIQIEAVYASPASGKTGESLSGVPLDSLAACVSDREEDSLKQQLMAFVAGRRECRSPAGSYRFVEMKNLNAFLMWIERAPGREVTDRCGELKHALRCIGNTSSRLRMQVDTWTGVHTG